MRLVQCDMVADMNHTFDRFLFCNPCNLRATLSACIGPHIVMMSLARIAGCFSACFNDYAMSVCTICQRDEDMCSN